ncbi:glycosyltransferase family 4 protein [Parvibaculum sp.]|uniref:glycosyltransferase family 4 protein n=1 Tax=Parvibaculum sp. TaxID=2024848 RepID=UPI002C0A7547|nr:glycosyltransferase family 4 protein [Parvibaculum sp.]HUD51271.1 glycosyltransferase family 4 protein [Parvibaculum sp.]
MTGERPRLLYIFPVALNLHAHWADRVRAATERYDVHVAVPFEASLEGLDLGKATLHNKPLRRGAPSIWGELVLVWRLFSLIRALRPALVHAVTIRPVIYGGVVARLLRVPALVCSVTGLGFLFDDEQPLARFLRPIAGHALRFVFAHPNARVIFENGGDRDDLVANGIVRADQSHVFVGGGLDLDQFSFSPEPPSGEPLVILPSRLIAAKGVREFVEAARRLKAGGVHARFALVGTVDTAHPDPIEQGDLDLWAREGIVECWGWREDMAEVIRSAAIICLPSYYREGAPRALIEAAAIGRPAVTTDWVGCRDVVVDGETGLLVPVRNVEALAAALRRLIEDRDLRERMGEAARFRAEDHFSNALAIERMFSVYDEVLPKD